MSFISGIYHSNSKLANSEGLLEVTGLSSRGDGSAASRFEVSKQREAYSIVIS